MITQNELKEALHFDPDNGIFTWIKLHPKAPFPEGTIAGAKQKKGIRIKVKKQFFYAHKLAVLYMTGIYPKDHVIHKNGDYYDNRICNLIIATPSQACLKVVTKRKSSNPRGVNWNKKIGKWESRAMVNGKRKSLGHFDDIESAKNAYENYMKDHYFI